MKNLITALSSALFGLAVVATAVAQTPPPPNQPPALPPVATPQLAPTPQPAPTPLTVTFTLHGSYFSQETGLQPAIDPQVFVVDDSAHEATGPQNIKHIAGVRPLQLGEPESSLVSAEGVPLLFTSEKWTQGRGTATIVDAPGGGQDITLRFTRLIAFGVYSMFKNSFSPAGVTFAPLDGDGTHNGFVADANGDATLLITTPQRLTNRNALLLVYHSDGVDHGVERGSVGVDAHHHLIAPIP